MNDIRYMQNYILQKKINKGTHDASLYVKDKTKKPKPSKWVIKHVPENEILSEFIAGKLFEHLINDSVPSIKIIYDSKNKTNAIASRYIENFISLKDFSDNHEKSTSFPHLSEFKKIVAYSIFLGDDDFHQSNIGISNNKYYKIDHGNALKINPEALQMHPIILLAKSIKKYNYDPKNYINKEFIDLLTDILAIDIEKSISKPLDSALLELEPYIDKDKIKDINLTRISNLNMSSLEDIGKSIIISLKIRQKQIESMRNKLKILMMINNGNIIELQDFLRSKPNYLFAKYYWHIEQYSYIEDNKFEKSMIFSIKAIEAYKSELYALMIEILASDLSKIITDAISNIKDGRLLINMNDIENELFNKYKINFDYRQLKQDILNICKDYIEEKITKEEIYIPCKEVATNIVNKITSSSDGRVCNMSQKPIENEASHQSSSSIVFKIGGLISSFRDKFKPLQSRKDNLVG